MLTGLGLFGAGLVKARVTRGQAVAAGLENLVIAGLGGAVAYALGGWVGEARAHTRKRFACNC